MKLMYLGKHAVLEYDEVLMFHEMGHKVFSLQGAYSNPAGHPTLPRPGIPGMEYFTDYERLSREYPSLNEIPMELIDPFDVIIVTGGYHDVPVISSNWKRLSKKKVIWRSIGQSTKDIEAGLHPFKQQGLKVVRYSPKERLIPNYMGEDVLIRFYKDPNEWKDWNGNIKQVINISQALKARARECHYQDVVDVFTGLPAKVYGHTNEPLGSLDGGAPSYHQLKEVYRDNRVLFYTGTWPASYTLSFMEAFMTGIPIVAIGKQWAEHIPGIDPFEFYEIHEIIQNGTNGFIANTKEEARRYIEMLLADYELAKRIGIAGRQTAINLFGREQIQAQWKVFLETV